MRCHFIPSYVLVRLAAAEDQQRAAHGHRTRVIDDDLRGRRQAAPAAAAAGADDWEIHTADNSSTLPGTLVRSAGQPEVDDVAVNEAATGITETLKLYTDYGRDSYDDKGATVIGTVHYEQNYDNAFWDGNQLVFGDGDGTTFDRFTKPIDVLGHELSHAVTQYTANLTYSGQSGALNESISDVFGSCVKQRHLGHDAASADWLIGEGIFLPSVKGVALRSMKAPGTAYDDPTIGKDPQVADMDHYDDTTDDDGGVHINSGIPNRAFYLAATAIGGNAWEGAGKIWYAVLTGGGISADVDFAGFAQATIAAAGDHADAVTKAWQTVGVAAGAGTGAGGSAPAPAPTDGGASATSLEVTRTGGIAGQVRHGRIDLDADDSRATEARELLDRVDLAAATTGEAAPDRYVYEFQCSPHHARVHEAALTADLARLAALALED